MTDAMDTLMDEPVAYALYMNSLRLGLSYFAIDKAVLSDALVQAWPKKRRERAVAVLIERGFVYEIIDPWGNPSRIYRPIIFVQARRLSGQA